MSSKRQPSKGKILAQEFCDRFPKKGNATVAKALYAAHPKVFANLEAARSVVRRARGAQGEMHRKNMGIESNLTPAHTPMPKSAARPRKPYKLPEGRTLLLSDIHVPYHDAKALEIALEFGDQFKPDNIYLNGDTIDFYAISRWEKDPEVRNLSQELERTRQLLMHLRARYGDDTRIIWKNGNHEDRWEKYLWNKAPELCGVSEYELKHILRFDEYDVDFVHSRQKTKAGRYLTIIHGHEILSAHDPVNFARTLCNKARVSTIAGHKHKSSEHTEKNADDEFITCWSVGCLQELHPDYAPMNQWNLGFATVKLKGNDFEVDNYRIVDGKVR